MSLLSRMTMIPSLLLMADHAWSFDRTLAAPGLLAYPTAYEVAFGLDPNVL